MQPVDLTTLRAICAELRAGWLPARLEQVYQRDRATIALALRTLKGRDWLTLSWHPQAARVCIEDPPPRTPDTFTFSDQLRHQLQGLALIAMPLISPWERVIDFQFAARPDDPPLWHLYGEIMGKYSNIILTNANQEIITAAHQVSPEKSSLRPVQTGQLYEPPPALTGDIPSREESQASWQERVSLIPDQLKRQLLKTYRGLGPNLVTAMIERAGLDPQQTTDSLTPNNWTTLFQVWQEWLEILETENFQPGWTENAFTVLGWGMIKPVASTQTLLKEYYQEQLNQQAFKQLSHQLLQKVSNLIKKQQQKKETFQQRLQQSDQAEIYRQQGDLLMAYSYQWEPGLSSMQLPDFETGELITIPLNPEKNAIQNAQSYYKQHQKLKRARQAVEPLLTATDKEINYLQQVEASLKQLTDYQHWGDLQTLKEIQEELIEQGYILRQRERTLNEQAQPINYYTPSGYEVLVGRNNRQNDNLTFRVATDYDLWFHSQEIPGSHVLLRLPAGAIPEEKDLQCAANIAAYYSRARESQQVPIIYTKPKYVYKPKGAKPGMALYDHETVIWGKPQELNSIN
ncbi:fibronectin/fibrinogen-binding protein [Euhalothece natronophila Z-M001]|uniref:Rqc2 homolog RqcH n=1 Tax=Euhalothece natronophila Z-M001 TaxID=522448 RepID=A0A5B8NKH2_9CHRO|nr:NFACT RNA binding domain-containing protein [Euhalothece natronophila]QDZ39742.1 fibronectin/fibrinogen-binding protein [Euhalothece natronophila Z-M001]